MRLLIVTAVEAEARAVIDAFDPATGTGTPAPTEPAPTDGPTGGTGSTATVGSVPRRWQRPSGPVDVVVGGVGVANAAAATALALCRTAGPGSTERADYDAVLDVGIAGGFGAVALGAVVVADHVVHADLGAEDGEIFRPVSALGFGTERHSTDPALADLLVRRTGAVRGAVLSVSTVTGSAATAAARLARCPDAVAEAMEGAGVLAAAQRVEVSFGELRTISNAVGPRERSSWRIGPALAALGAAVAAVTAAPFELPAVQNR